MYRAVNCYRLENHYNPENENTGNSEKKLKKFLLHIDERIEITNH